MLLLLHMRIAHYVEILEFHLSVEMFIYKYVEMKNNELFLFPFLLKWCSCVNVSSWCNRLLGALGWLDQWFPSGHTHEP